MDAPVRKEKKPREKKTGDKPGAAAKVTPQQVRQAVYLVFIISCFPLLSIFPI
jgi:hypothetical protein